MTCDLARRANGVLVRPVRPVEFGDGLDGPSRSDSVRPCVHERVDGVIAEFVLEDDEAGRLGTGDPLLEVRVDCRDGSPARLVDAPVRGARVQSVS